MAGGDPVEFVRNLLNGTHQRVGNRTQRQAFTITPVYVSAPPAGDAVIVLPPPGAGFAWRFDRIHYSYDSVQAVGLLLINDGATIEVFYIQVNTEGDLSFETTRWAENAFVTITLVNGGVGIAGALAVHGTRIESVNV